MIMTPRRLIQTIHTLKASHSLSQQQALHALSNALRTFIDDSGSIFDDLPRFSKGLYSRVLLNDPEDDFQIVIVSWPPGQQSPIHDHAENLGVVAALSGEIEETKYRVLHRGSTVQLEPLSSAQLSNNFISPLIDDDEHQIHSMRNSSEHEWGVSVHIYLNAMRTFNVYRPVSCNRYLPVETPLWFDTQTHLSDRCFTKVHHPLRSSVLQKSA